MAQVVGLWRRRKQPFLTHIETREPLKNDGQGLSAGLTREQRVQSVTMTKEKSVNNVWVTGRSRRGCQGEADNRQVASP